MQPRSSRLLEPLPVFRLFSSCIRGRRLLLIAGAVRGLALALGSALGLGLGRWLGRGLGRRAAPRRGSGSRQGGDLLAVGVGHAHQSTEAAPQRTSAGPRQNGYGCISYCDVEDGGGCWPQPLEGEISEATALL